MSRKLFPKDIVHQLGRHAFSVFTWLAFRWYVRLHVNGRQNVPDFPFIICSNHQSHLDAVILSHLGHANFSKTAMIAAKDYWYDNRLLFYFSRLFFNTIPINRSEQSSSFGLREVSEIANDFLKEHGKCIAMLPEGSRGRTSDIRPFKKGINVLSRTCNLPIVPLYIEGSGKLWPKGSLFVRPGVVAIEIGAPISFEQIQTDPNIIYKQVQKLKRRCSSSINSGLQ